MLKTDQAGPETGCGPGGPPHAEEELHWLAMRLTPGLGMRKAVQLIEQFRSPQAVFRASRGDLEGFGLSGSVAQSIASGCSFDDAVDQQRKMVECGATLVPIADPRYPPRLREIYDPPLLLFVHGRIELLQSLMLGVVGTRRPSAYGIAATEKLTPDLARCGLTIVSGMARGIDTSAHRGALSAGGDTVAVFGCGVDQVYPAENRKLASELATKGLLISEFPMQGPAYPQNFPIRNRIISGMSAGVLIIEGAQYSGSAITARLALDQQREVFALPGNITSKMSWGPNLLIKQGAKLVQEWNDVVVELPADVRRQLMAKVRERQGSLVLEAESAPEIGVLARALLKLIPPDIPVQLDHLLDNFEACSPAEAIATLFELEMLGLIRQLPGKNYVKVW